MDTESRQPLPSHVDILVAIEGLKGQLISIEKAAARSEGVYIGLDSRVRNMEIRSHVEPEALQVQLAGIKDRYDRRIDWIQTQLLLATGGVAVLVFIAPFVINAISPKLDLMPGINSAPPHQK
jgi:hypothetical protein